MVLNSNTTSEGYWVQTGYRSWTWFDPSLFRMYMMLPFEKYDWLMIKDIERCPYIWKDYQYSAWWKDNEQRQLLIALDRYADFLQHKLKEEDTPRQMPGRIITLTGGTEF